MEIGGYFGLENLIHKEYYPDLIALNTARNAVAYLIKTKRIKKLYIPSYLCDSIYKVCEREGCLYEFYEIDADFQPVFNQSLKDDEWLYIVNYFGQVANVKELKATYERIIIDNVQAFFEKPSEGIDTLYSCRKFFGVPDGSYLSSDLLINVEEDISFDRMTHILGRYEKTASEYYSTYTDNEEKYYDLPIKHMSKLTHNIMGAIDYEDVKKRRETNFHYLHNKLHELNGITVKETAGPFAYPFYVKDGMRIKKALAMKGIFIATLWPTAIPFGGLAKDYSENILPLPCDQRYTIEDMKIVVECLLDIIGLGVKSHKCIEV